MSNRLDAVKRHHQLRALLGAIKAGYLSLAEQEPVSRSGRSERADPIGLGVEGLASFWEAHAGRPVNMSRSNGRFLAFATDILAEPLRVTEATLRHALSEYIAGRVGGTKLTD